MSVVASVGSMLSAIAKRVSLLVFALSIASVLAAPVSAAAPFPIELPGTGSGSGSFSGDSAPPTAPGGSHLAWFDFGLIPAREDTSTLVIPGELHHPCAEITKISGGKTAQDFFDGWGGRAYLSISERPECLAAPVTFELEVYLLDASRQMTKASTFFLDLVGGRISVRCNVDFGYVRHDLVPRPPVGCFTDPAEPNGLRFYNYIAPATPEVVSRGVSATAVGEASAIKVSVENGSPGPIDCRYDLYAPRGRFEKVEPGLFVPPFGGPVTIGASALDGAGYYTVAVWCDHFSLPGKYNFVMHLSVDENGDSHPDP